MKFGFIKLWRKSKDSPMIKDHKLWVMWTYILMNASHQSNRVYVNGTIKYIEPGQYAFTVKELAEKINMTRHEINGNLKKLVNMDMIQIISGNKMTIISVINWGKYQSSKPFEQKQNRNNSETTQELPPYDNIHKNVKNGENCHPVFFSDVPQELVGVINWLNKSEG